VRLLRGVVLFVAMVAAWAVYVFMTSFDRLFSLWIILAHAWPPEFLDEFFRCTSEISTLDACICNLLAVPSQAGQGRGRPGILLSQ
jgi:hypothetical protein